jgi:hypothetical protein
MLKTFSVPFLILALAAFAGFACVDNSGNKVYSHGGTGGNDGSTDSADSANAPDGGADASSSPDGAAGNDGGVGDGLSLDLLGDL